MIVGPEASFPRYLARILLSSYRRHSHWGFLGLSIDIGTKYDQESYQRALIAEISPFSEIGPSEISIAELCIWA